MTEFSEMWQDAAEFVEMLGIAQAADSMQHDTAPEGESESGFDGIEAITYCYQR